MPRDDSTPPASGTAIIIDPSSPLTVAQEFLDRTYRDPRQPRLLRHRGTFFQWRRTWSELGEESIRASIYEFLASCFRVGKDGDGLAPIKPNVRLVGEVLSALKAVAFVADDIEPPVWLRGGRQPKPGEIIVFKNGLLHLPTLELIPPTPEFFNLNSLEIDWDENAEEPEHWLSFLKQLWPDDTESIDTLQRIFGYCLTPDTRLHTAFMVVGPIRSGKGTIGRVLAALVGKRNTVTPTLSALGSHFGRASLIGKRLALIGDAKVGRDTDPVLLAEHLLEITGEDGVTIPRKNLPDWIGVLSLKFVVLCTEVPQMTDDSAGIAFRFIILQLVKSFLGQEDTDLTEKLLGELPGIAVWAVAGWHALFGKEGTGRIAQPGSAQGHVDDIRDLASDIKQYLDERCAFNPDFTVEKTVIYKDYCSWREAQGRRILAKAVFGKKLRTAFPQLSDYRPRSGSGAEEGRPRYYAGLTLR